MTRRIVNYILTLAAGAVPTIWLLRQILAGKVSPWVVVVWAMTMVFCIALTYGEEKS